MSVIDQRKVITMVICQVAHICLIQIPFRTLDFYWKKMNGLGPVVFLNVFHVKTLAENFYTLVISIIKDDSVYPASPGGDKAEGSIPEHL